MYTLDDIRTVHLELTSKCNARCPMCPRTANDRANERLPIQELDLADIERIFPVAFVQQLNRIYLCGNFGDPVAASDCLAILRYFRRHNASLDLGVHTNGGLRSVAWWRALAPVVTSCRFGIDGLEDTNDLYRRGVQWKTVMANATSFIQGGGHAEWAFLVFEHNEHQIDAARRLAAELGFKSFIVKSTFRFSSVAATNDSFPVRSRNGEILYQLRPPRQVHLKHPLAQEALAERPAAALRRVDCKAVCERSIFVSAEGLAFPCCWLASELYPSSRRQAATQLADIVEGLPAGKETLSVKRRSLREVIAGTFFQDCVPSGWDSNKGSTRIGVCDAMCGSAIDLSAGQFIERSSLVPVDRSQAPSR